MESIVTPHTAHPGDDRISAITYRISDADWDILEKECMLFQGLSSEDFADLKNKYSPCVFVEAREANAEIYLEKEPNDHRVYLILEGEVKIKRHFKGGGEVTLRGHRLAGDILGELECLIEEARVIQRTSQGRGNVSRSHFQEVAVRVATMITATPTRIVVIKRNDFMNLLRDYKLIPINLAILLSRKLVNVLDESSHRPSEDREAGRVSRAAGSVLQRLCRELLAEVDRAVAEGKTFDANGALEVTANQKDLATRIHASRESVIRAVATLRKEGIVGERARSRLDVYPKGIRHFLDSLTPHSAG